MAARHTDRTREEKEGQENRVSKRVFVLKQIYNIYTYGVLHGPNFGPNVRSG